MSDGHKLERFLTRSTVVSVGDHELMGAGHSRSRIGLPPEPGSPSKGTLLSAPTTRRLTFIDDNWALDLAPNDVAFYSGFTAARRDALARRVDWHLLPVLSALYMLAMLDRANIGNAKIEGMVGDLGLLEYDFNVALAVFFVPYVLAEVPSNVLLDRCGRKAWYLAGMSVLWGLAIIGHAFVQNLVGLCAMRILLGLFEAGFFPGAVYLMTLWYHPSKLALRMAIMMAACGCSGILSGLLAACIAKLDGALGLDGWRWIFLLEGVLTVVLGFATAFILPDMPERCRSWLSDDDVRFLRLQERIHHGKLDEVAKKSTLAAVGKSPWSSSSSSSARGHCGGGRDSQRWIHQRMYRWINRRVSPVTWGSAVDVATDWKLYAHALIYLFIGTCAVGLKFALPTVTMSLGFSNTAAQLLTMPPYLVGAVSALTTGYYSDLFRLRAPFLMASLVAIVTGYAVIFAFRASLATHFAATYAASILVYAGMYPVGPINISWIRDNVRGDGRAGMGIALVASIGAMSGLGGSFVFLESQAPTYPTGFGVSLGFAVAALVLTCCLVTSYRWRNERRQKETEKEMISGKWDELELFMMGDRSPLFRYTL